MKKIRFVIINTCDAPIRKHIAEWVDGVGYCYMSRTSLPYLKKFDGMQPAEPTPSKTSVSMFLWGRRRQRLCRHGKVPLSMKTENRASGRNGLALKNLLSFP